MNFKIRVVENLGVESKEAFGETGTILDVANGSLRDNEGFDWNNNFKNICEIHDYFNNGKLDWYKTKFELVEDVPHEN